MGRNRYGGVKRGINESKRIVDFRFLDRICEESKRSELDEAIPKLVYKDSLHPVLGIAEFTLTLSGAKGNVPIAWARKDGCRILT